MTAIHTNCSQSTLHIHQPQTPEPEKATDLFPKPPYLVSLVGDYGDVGWFLDQILTSQGSSSIMINNKEAVQVGNCRAEEIGDSDRFLKTKVWALSDDLPPDLISMTFIFREKKKEHFSW